MGTEFRPRELWHYSFAIIRKGQVWTPWTTIVSQEPDMGGRDIADEAARELAIAAQTSDGVLGVYSLYERILGGGYGEEDKLWFLCGEHGEPTWTQIDRPASSPDKKGRHVWSLACGCEVTLDKLLKLERERRA